MRISIELGIRMSTYPTASPISRTQLFRTLHPSFSKILSNILRIQTTGTMVPLCHSPFLLELILHRLSLASWKLYLSSLLSSQQLSSTSKPRIPTTISPARPLAPHPVPQILTTWVSYCSRHHKPRHSTVLKTSSCMCSLPHHTLSIVPLLYTFPFSILFRCPRILASRFEADMVLVQPIPGTSKLVHSRRRHLLAIDQ